MRPLALLVFAAALHAQTFTNGDFEKGAAGEAPQAWGPNGVWVTDGCHQGSGCGEVFIPSGAQFGQLTQSVDVTPYRGKLVRFRAAVRVIPPGRAGLWLRVDRPNQQMGFFENMQARPITAGDWQYYEIDGWVHPDAQRMYLGILAYAGKARIDDASLTITGDIPPVTEEPARELTLAGLTNLTAFTHLYGIVRNFHPSDEAASADWNRIAIEGVRKAEGAHSSEQLAKALQETFEPVAPTVRVFVGAEPKPPPPPNGATHLMRIHNKGYGGGRVASNIYRTTRTKSDLATWKPQDVYRLDLGGGVTALVPLAVFADDTGTLPHAAKPAEKIVPVPATLLSANDRAIHLADIVIAWNVFDHFYPYFDVTGATWEPLLPDSLKEAATAKDGSAFHVVLKKLVAELEDGHGNVSFSGAPRFGLLPLRADWIEDKLIVTFSKSDDVHPGDEIIAINGKLAEAALTDAEKLISGATPQWKRFRAIGEVLAGPPGQTCVLTVMPPGAAEAKEVRVNYGAFQSMPNEPRPEKVTAELEPGIWYFDLTRAQDKDFDEALPKLVQAKGIVFDMRGYPRVSAAWFSHVTKTPMSSAQWHVPLVDRPGEMVFERDGEWQIAPKEPYLQAKKVWLTDGGAISYAETTMGIVEAYKLGDIVGDTTAGTNGNVNPFDLPGGYTIAWTGMKVLKHDGSRHHGIGIAPTVPAFRTQKGVAAGKDEVLDRGVAALKEQ